MFLAQRCFWVILVFLLSTSSVPAAELWEIQTETSSYSGLAPQVTGSWLSLNPSVWGGELGISFLMPPIPTRGLWVGPHLGVLWAGGSDSTYRSDFELGGESILWIANAVGAGLRLDLLVPNSIFFSSISVPARLRVEPHLSVRFLRFKEEGAWAMRLGLSYDTFYRWGISAGISLQWSGVYRAVEPI